MNEVTKTNAVLAIAAATLVAAAATLALPVAGEILAGLAVVAALGGLMFLERRRRAF